MLLTPRLHKSSFQIIPGTCRMCRMLSGRSMELCAECEQGLPLMLEQCIGCALPKRHSHIARCARCLLRPPIYRRCFAPYSYDGLVRYLHHSFKFEQDLAAGQILAELMAERIQEAVAAAAGVQLGAAGPDAAVAAVPEVVVPVPTHWRRRLKRGFDQAEVIAETLAVRFDLPLARALKRERAGVPQQGLSAEARARNVMGAFKLRESQSPGVRGKHIALIDDVLTTGATVTAAARALLQEEAASVEVWCLARAMN